MIAPVQMRSLGAAGEGGQSNWFLTFSQLTELGHKSVAPGAEAKYFGRPTSPSWSGPPCLLNLHSVLATFVWLFLQYTRQFPASGPLHGPFPLSGTLSPRRPHVLLQECAQMSSQRNLSWLPRYCYLCPVTSQTLLLGQFLFPFALVFYSVIELNYLYVDCSVLGSAR